MGEYSAEFIEQIKKNAETIERNTHRGKFTYAYSHIQDKFIKFEDWVEENKSLFETTNEY